MNGEKVLYRWFKIPCVLIFLLGKNCFFDLLTSHLKLIATDNISHLLPFGVRQLNQKLKSGFDFLRNQSVACFRNRY